MVYYIYDCFIGAYCAISACINGFVLLCIAWIMIVSTVFHCDRSWSRT